MMSKADIQQKNPAEAGLFGPKSIRSAAAMIPMLFAARHGCDTARFAALAGQVMLGDHA